MTAGRSNIGVELLIESVGATPLSGPTSHSGQAPHRTAMGFTGDPTAPVIGRGAATSWQS